MEFFLKLNWKKNLSQIKIVWINTKTLLFNAQIKQFLITSSCMDFVLSFVSEEKAKHEAKRKL